MKEQLRILWSGIWRMLVCSVIVIAFISLFILSEVIGFIAFISIVFFGFSYMIGLMIEMDRNTLPAESPFKSKDKQDDLCSDGSGKATSN